MSYPTEHEEQVTLCEWMWAHKIRYFSVPNGARLSNRLNRYAHIYRLKREGLTPGAPDLVLVDLAPSDSRPVAIELKRRSGGSLSVMQRAMRDIAIGAGWHHILAYGAQDAVEQLMRLGFVGRWWA